VAKKAANQEGNGQTSISGVAIHNYRSDAKRWNVFFHEGTSDAALEAWCDQRCELMGHPDENGIAFAEITCDVQDLQTALEAATSNDIVEFIEPDGESFASGISEDGAEAGEEEGEAQRTASWGLERVGVPSASNNGRGVSIYVHDTGIRVSHRDFGGRAVTSLDGTSGTLRECRGSTSCARDVHGHGTHCAGSAGGTTFGVASRARLLAVKVLNDQGRGSNSWNVAALDWIARRATRSVVSSMSLGGSGQSSSYRRSIDDATRRGVIVVVAAGNENADACNFSPAFVPTAITVASSTSRNARSGFSNFGRCNNIFAPGSSIRSASAGSNTGSTSMSGTSMACPHVAGAVALLLQSNPSHSRDRVMSQMNRTGLRGRVSGMRSRDPDLFLWVGRSSR